MDKHILKTIKELMESGANTALKILGDNEIIRAKRKTYKSFGKKPQKRGNVEIILTIGKPNYSERSFIKSLKKAGEKFPVKHVMLKFAPKKK